MKPQVPTTHSWHRKLGREATSVEDMAKAGSSPQQGGPKTSKPCACHTDPTRQRGPRHGPRQPPVELSPPSPEGEGATPLRSEEEREREVRRRPWEIKSGGPQGGRPTRPDRLQPSRLSSPLLPRASPLWPPTALGYTPLCSPSSDTISAAPPQNHRCPPTGPE